MKWISKFNGKENVKIEEIIGVLESPKKKQEKQYGSIDNNSEGGTNDDVEIIENYTLKETSPNSVL